MTKKMMGLRGAVSVAAAAMLAVSLAAPAAWADPADTAASTLAKKYAGTTYRVSVFSGNQGTLAAGAQEGQTEIVRDKVPYGELFSFEDFTVTVPDDSKYYAKGVRLAALDNVRSDKNRDGATQIGDDTVYYARANDEGVLVDTREASVDGQAVQGAPITEDMDFVVAYGIKANRVAYTVSYLDAETGEALREAETFYGDIGDVPATAPRYVEGYLPDATLVLLTLSADESKNVIEFRYTRLADGTSTELNPDGTVDITVPPTTETTGGTTGGETTGGAGTGTGTGTGAGTGTGTAGAGTTGADAGNTADAAYTTVVEPGAAEAAEENIADEAVPLITANGQEVLAADGTPATTPGVEQIEDDGTALASGEQPGDVASEPSTAWIPWAVAAGVLACAILIVLVNARRKQDTDEA